MKNKVTGVVCGTILGELAVINMENMYMAVCTNICGPMPPKNALNIFISTQRGTV